MGAIGNREELCSHGDGEAREFLADVVDEALSAVHPDRLVSGRVTCRDGTLHVDGRSYDLDAVEEVLVVGAGKGSLALVRAVADTLGDRISRGLVVEKHGHGDGTGRVDGGEDSGVPDGVEVHEAGHPVPDEAGHRAVRRAMELARGADENDLVLACITGGASALLALPVKGITLDELAETTRLLLEAGAPIEDVNAVRKHLSRVKGGRLAEAIHPATTVTLVIVDEVAGEPWGPTVPDPTTFDDAIRALEKHDLWERVPGSVRGHLEGNRSHPANETPTAEAFEALETQAVVLADAGDACEAACAAARDRGVEPMLLSTVIEGESREAGTCLAGIAKEVAARGRPAEPPCALVSGGETTVTVDEDAGEGGPNQEFALGAALALDGIDGVAAVAVGTDGTDGPTDLAGGLVDAGTVERAERLGVDLHRALREHDSSTALRALDDAVYTGPTGTNVMDLRVILVRGADDAG